jgi:hypothetical protein
LKIVDEKLNFLCLEVLVPKCFSSLWCFFIWSTKTKNLTSNGINYKKRIKTLVWFAFTLLNFILNSQIWRIIPWISIGLLLFNYRGKLTKFPFSSKRCINLSSSELKSGFHI